MCDTLASNGCVVRIQWLRNPGRPSDLRHLAGDVACFSLLTLLMGVGVWLGVEGFIDYRGTSGRLGWDAIWIIVLLVFQVLSYLAWCIVSDISQCS